MSSCESWERQSSQQSTDSQKSIVPRAKSLYHEEIKSRRTQKTRRKRKWNSRSDDSNSKSRSSVNSILIRVHSSPMEGKHSSKTKRSKKHKYLKVKQYEFDKE